jgi:hypothetical protein
MCVYTNGERISLFFASSPSPPTPRYIRKWPHIIHASHHPAWRSSGGVRGGGVRNRGSGGCHWCVRVGVGGVGWWPVGWQKARGNWIVFQARHMHIHTHWPSSFLCVSAFVKRRWRNRIPPPQKRDTQLDHRNRKASKKSCQAIPGISIKLISRAWWTGWVFSIKDKKGGEEEETILDTGRK